MGRARGQRGIEVEDRISRVRLWSRVRHSCYDVESGCRFCCRSSNSVISTGQRRASNGALQQDPPLSTTHGVPVSTSAPRMETKSSVRFQEPLAGRLFFNGRLIFANECASFVALSSPRSLSLSGCPPVPDGRARLSPDMNYCCFNYNAITNGSSIDSQSS